MPTIKAYFHPRSAFILNLLEYSFLLHGVNFKMNFPVNKKDSFLFRRNLYQVGNSFLFPALMWNANIFFYSFLICLFPFCVYVEMFRVVQVWRTFYKLLFSTMYLFLFGIVKLLTIGFRAMYECQLKIEGNLMFVSLK